MILLLGISHVSSRSSQEVKEAIFDVDVVALELDQGRAEGLLSNKKATFSELRAALGIKTALIASILRWVQEKIAKGLGVMPGLEMKAGLIEGRKQKKIIAVIDRPIQITLQRLSKNFGWKEVRQMAKDSFKRQKISIHPDDDLVAQLLEQMKDNYPRIYKVMVSERDHFMAQQLVALQELYPDKNILAVVGKAHIPGLKQQISYLNKDVAVQAWSSQAKNANTSSSSASLPA